MKPFFQKILLFILFISLLENTSKAQNACGCVNCPMTIIDNNIVTSVINIKGALNNDLASASQAVCRVCVKFRHDFVSDLQVTLVAPSGQSLLLLAPISQQGFTSFSQWNVCFVPCGTAASPDKGFPAKWTNGGWGFGANYNGSYYPFVGCLEEFNTGVVNGDWKLVIKDGDAQQAGILLDWTIEFCDPNGIDCIRCDAKAGSLSSYPAVSACKGNSKLNLAIPPKYTASNSAPSAAYYSYSYVISKNDTIKRIQPTADLRSLPVGKYTVCGMSYRTTDASKIPLPDNKLTVTQLKSQIAKTPQPFCAQLSTVCVPVEIYDNPVKNIDTTVCRCLVLNNVKYCQSGFYQQKLKTKDGCDSSLNINVNVIPPRVMAINTTTCKGVPYVIGTKKYTKQGIYKDTLVSQVTKCDSFVTLNLLVRDPNILNYTVNICEGDSILQAGKYYKKQQIYIDTVKTKAGCDSILKLDLRIKKGNTNLQKETLCEGGFITIEGKKYDKTGIYNIKLNQQSANGCDSILQLNLKINPIYKDTLRLQICQGDTIKIGKSKYFVTGNYVDKILSKFGCDSTVFSFIEVKSKITIFIKKGICQGEIYRFNGKNLSVSGTYNAAGKSKNGCDSLTELVLTVYPKPIIKRNYTVCYGDTLQIGKRRYHKTGLYRDTLLTSFGCDSIHESNVIALPRLETYLTQTLCKPSVVIVGKKVYSTTGIYLDTIQTQTGCDSIIRLDLTMNSPKDTLINLDYCFGKNPANFPTSKDYILKLKTQQGCDSTVTYQVKIYPENKTTINAQICPGAAYYVNNQQFKAAGTYVIKDTSWVTGCDSTITLNLSVTSQIKVKINKEICQGDFIEIDGKNYDTPQNNLIIPLKSVAGCDSIITLNLKVNPLHLIVLNDTICDGSCTTIGNVKYCKSGLYKIETKNRFGCDSLVSIVITVKKRPVTELNASICKGEFYQLGKKKIYESGFFQDTLRATNGCDSILSLDLDVKPLSKDSLFETVCFESSLKEGLTKTIFKGKNGCDSTFILNRIKLKEKKSTLNLTICKGQTIKIGNTIYDKSGTFKEVIPNVGKYKCDSSIALTINVLDSIVQNKAVVLCNGENYKHNGKVYTKPLSLKEKSSSINNCDSIYNLAITVVACQLKYRIKTIPLTCQNTIAAGFVIEALDSNYVNYFYSWASISNGIFSSQALLKGNKKDTVSGLSVGKYIIKIHNGAGLLRQDTISFEIPKPLSFNIKTTDYQGFSVSCASARDARIVLNVSGGQPPYRYLWNNGMIVPSRDKIAAGHYSVTVTDSLNCKTVFDTLLTAPPAMQVQMKFKMPTCYDYEDGAMEVLNIVNGNAPYLYSIDNQSFSTNKIFNKLIATPHLLRIKDAKGCIMDTAFILVQPPKIVVNMGLDTTIELGEKVNIKAQVNLAANDIAKIIWNDFVKPTCPTCLETNVAPLQNTGYLLTIFDKNNCVGRDELFVFVKDLPIFAPTIFSPNDDGTNDYFTLFGNANVFKIKILHIYNRWGDVVFEGKNILPNEVTQGWDGKYKGVRQQPAVFVYVAEIELFDGSLRQLNGEVFLAE